MENNTPKKYSKVEVLKATVDKHQLTFKLNDAININAEGFITVKMQAADHQFIIPLMDEFGDFDVQKPTLALHLVLLACEDFEEAEDYLVWCKALGLKAKDETCRAAWFHLRDEAPNVRAFFGDQVQAVDVFNYQMGAGATQLLRQIDATQ